MNRKGVAPIAILLVIVGVLIIGGVWYHLSSQNGVGSGTNPPATTSSSTTGWLTYTDNVGDFSILYPADYHIQQHISSSTSGNPYLTLSIYSGSDAGNWMMLISRIFKKDDFPESTFNGLLGKLADRNRIIPGSVNYSTSTATIGGYPANVIFSSSKTASVGTFIFDVKDYTFSILVEYGRTPSEIAANKALSQKIIDSFKVGH